MLSVSQVFNRREACVYDEGKEAREQRARSHLVRVAILALLAEDDRQRTVVQIRAELPGGLTLRNVHYHLKILEASRLVVEDRGCYRLT
jgi:predicted transcriptional regulator